MAGLAIVTANEAIPANTLTPVDARATSITLTFPPGADGLVVGVSDIYGAASTNAIALAAQGSGVTLADPSIVGTYAATGHISAAGTHTYWWVFASGTISVPINKWLPLWW